MIAIRMKYGSVKEGTGKTFIYTFDLKGNQVYTSEKVKFLGSGAFGDAYAYQTDTDEGQEALKLAKTRHGEGDSRELLSERMLQRAAKDVENEVEMLQSLHTDENGKPVIVPGLQLPPKNIIVVLKGNLQIDRVKEEKTKVGYNGVKYSGDCWAGEKIGNQYWTDNWGVKNIFNGVKDLGSALEHCHKRNVFLGDIKDGNIFRDDKSKKLYLADLGGAKQIKEQRDIPPPETSPFTPGYISEKDARKLNKMENLATDTKLSQSKHEKLLNAYKELKEKVDVHALGVSIFGMLAPHVDFAGQIWENPSSANSTRKNIPNYLLNANLPPKTAKILGSLLQKMTDPDPKNRPTSEEANRILQSIEFA